jgi:hypothetical protein
MCFALQGGRSEMDRRKNRREIRQSMMDPDDDEPIFGPRGSMDRRNDPIFGNTKQDAARPNLSALAAMLKPVIDLDDGDNLLSYKCRMKIFQQKTSQLLRRPRCDLRRNHVSKADHQWKILTIMIQYTAPSNRTMRNHIPARIRRGKVQEKTSRT